MQAEDEQFPQQDDEGEMVALVRSKDWAHTPLGPPVTWSPSLRTILRLMLTSRYAMWMGWGPDLTFFYNDAYAAQTLGAKHPWALGRSAREVWAEIWDAIGPRIDHVLRTGKATWDEGLLLFLERSGYPEETYHTFSYSPAPGDATGEIAGMFCVVIEETERVIGERRIALLRDFAAGLGVAKTEDDVFAALERCLTNDARDVPFSLTYLFDSDGKNARRASQTNFVGAHPAAPEQVAVNSTSPWSLDTALTSMAPKIVELDAAEAWPTGAWKKVPSHALLLPIAQQGQARPAGVFVAGMNPHRPLDQSLRSFVELFVGQLAASLASVRAFEEEKRRAEALAEIDRAKTTFFSNVSHEFRTPLTLMLGPTEDALGSPERALYGAELETVHRNELRLLKLVNALLDFARIEAGRIEASFAPTDLCALTVDLVSSFRSAIERAGLTFEVNCSSSPEPIYVDHDMWEKIVLNLLSNALKFTFEGSISVVLRWCEDHAELVVRDTGVGIEKSHLPRLFERFHRIEGARARTLEGSGIGLALVQELVRMHGGSVEVTSQIGQGTTFKVSIPRGVAHLPSGRVGAARALASTSAGAAYVEEAMRWVPAKAGSPERPEEQAKDAARIVVADDNLDMRGYIARLLRQHWNVEVVSDGVEALEAIRQRHPDLVLSDVMMTRLDGFGLVRELRANAATAAIPIILLSARAGDEAVAEGLRSGADDYLVKPFSANALVVRIEAQLSAARLRDALRRNAEEERARMRLMFDESPAAICVVRGYDLVIEVVNARCLEVWGRKGAQALVGRPLLEALPELRVQLDYVARLRQVLSTGQAFHAEETLVRMDRVGSGDLQDYYFTLTYAPLRQADGTTDGVFVHAFDVTEQVLARRHVEELRAAAEETNRVLERRNTLALLGAEVGQAFTLGGRLPEVLDRCCISLVKQLDAAFARVWTLDDAGRVLELQASAGMYTHLEGAHARVRVGDLKIGRIAATRKPYVTNDVSSDTQISDPEWARREGMTSFAGYPLIIANDLVGVVALFARHALGKDTLATFSSVADTIAIGIARSREEAERARLYAAEQEARKDAEVANRVKDEFLATMSHELRTPLSAILGWAGLLRRKTHDPKSVDRALETIERNAKTQARLIEDVLDVSRIISGKLRLEMRKVDLNAIARAAVDVVRPAADAKRLNLVVDLPSADDVELVGDADRLQQIIWNLLSNAVKFTPREGSVSLGVERVGSTARIVVSDTGPGIAADHLPFIFDRFRQVDSSTTRMHGGLGLGLAIVRHMVELHGGTVTAEGGERRGAIFTVVLPIRAIHHGVADEEQLAEVQAMPSDDHSRATASLAGVRLLVVDDDEDSRLLLETALSRAGASVKVVDSARAALAFLESRPVDVLISDIGMPEEDGFSLMKRVRALPASRGGQVPAVALTAFARREDASRALQVGYQCHLAKPADLDVLVNTVATLLEESRSDGAA